MISVAVILVNLGGLAMFQITPKYLAITNKYRYQHLSTGKSIMARRENL